MWKRLGNGRGGPQGTGMSIGSPVLTETTLDARDYPSVQLPSPSPPERYIQPLRTRKLENKGLPSLPFEAMPPSPHDHRDSASRAPSTIYSEFMPHPLNTKVPRDSYVTVTTTYTEDISPPSSPEVGTMKRYQNANADDDNVSPIDNTPNTTTFEVKKPINRPGSSSMQTSSIPVMRREKKRNQVAAAAQNLVSKREAEGRGRPTQDPRWDPYSGEITTSDRGKPQSVKPGQFSPPALRSVNRGAAMGNESSVNAPGKQQISFTDRVRKLKLNNSNPPEKPGWKGASGRVTLVTPVSDNPDIKPLSLPRREEKVESPVAISPTPEFRQDETYQHHNPLMSNPASQEPSSPPVHSNTSSLRTDSLNSTSTDPFEVRSSVVATSESRSRPESRENSIPRGVTQSTIVRNFHQDLAEAFPKKEEEPYVQPSSRFSVTTYAPTTAHPTPRPSTDTWEQPEMPPLPAQSSVPSPVIGRSRPPVLGNEPRLPRKAVGSGTEPVFLGVTASLPARRVSQMSTLSKHLPQSPAEASSNDLISSLQAQIENLRHRRHNIVKSIRQMTELMPQDRVVITEDVRRKREMEKKKVEGLREEEADVISQEHELGLKLHRAYKRRDNEGIYEPTTLWVRRVTG